MRQVVKEECRDYFEDIVECNINAKDLMSSDSLFITNSIIKVLPVSYVEEKKFTIEEILLAVENIF